jgi:hypothetical protein
MKIKLFTFSACCLTLLAAGCVGTLDDKNRAGWPFGKDTVEGRYERPPDQVWKAAKDTLTYNGVLTTEDVLKKVLEAKVNTRSVWIRVEAVNPSLTSVLVQVRTKGGGKDMNLASELDKQIAVRLATGNLMPATAPSQPPK